MKRPDIVRRIAEVIHRIAPDAKTILYGLTTYINTRDEIHDALKRAFERITV